MRPFQIRQLSLDPCGFFRTNWPCPDRRSALRSKPVTFRLLGSSICLRLRLRLFRRFECRSAISGSSLVSFLCRQNRVWSKRDRPHRRKESRPVRFSRRPPSMHSHRRLFPFPSSERRSEASSRCAVACSFDAFDLTDPCGRQKMKRCLKKHVTLSTTRKIYLSQNQNRS